MEEIICRKAKN